MFLFPIFHNFEKCSCFKKSFRFQQMFPFAKYTKFVHKFKRYLHIQKQIRKFLKFVGVFQNNHFLMFEIKKEGKTVCYSIMARFCEPVVQRMPACVTGSNGPTNRIVLLCEVYLLDASHVRAISCL